MALLSSALPLGVKPRDGLQAIALGLLSFLAFPPIGWGPISLIILCRMLTFLRDQPTAVARNLGVLFGLGFAASTMYWLINVFGISAIALMGLMAAYFGLLGTFIGMTREYRPALRAALVAVFIVGIEWLRGDAWYLRFPWYTVPHALADSPRWIAGAHWLGSYGLSLVIWFVAGLGAYCWKPFWVILLLLPACAWLLPDVGTTDRKALLIQTEGQFISTEMLDKIPKEHVDLTVLPEYTYYTSPASALRSSHGPTTLARRMSSPVVFGAVEGEYGTPKFDNLAVVIAADGSVLGTFPKQRPVPLMYDGVPGKTRPTFRTADGVLGIAICFDYDAPEIAASLVADGATVLVDPTFDNISWGDVQHRHHELLLRLRAVETDRWILRAASSGRTEAVSPHGVPSKEGVEIGGPGFVIVDFAHRTSRTLGSRMYWLGPIAEGVTVLWLVVVGWRRFRNRLKILG